jgi:hypothetical protein
MHRPGGLPQVGDDGRGDRGVAREGDSQDPGRRSGGAEKWDEGYNR